MANKKQLTTKKKVREIRRQTRKKYSSEEKIRIILEGLRGEDSIAEICRREGIHPNLYYNWSKEFLEAGQFKDKTTAPNQMWQSDFTYLKVIGWGWYFLDTVLDDYSRYIIHHKLCSNMTSDDASVVVEEAKQITGIKPGKWTRLLTDNGPCFIGKVFKEFLLKNEITHIKGKTFHPQTQGKIERYHRTMKNVIKLENYYLPQELEQKIKEFVDYYNNERYHESLNNLTPADAEYQRMLLRMLVYQQEELIFGFGTHRATKSELLK
jgi:transposase InsO family protein